MLKNDGEVGEAFSQPPIVAYKRPCNIKDQLVRSKLGQYHDSNSPPGTHPCNKHNCKACPFLDRTPLLKGHQSDFVVKKMFSCQMTNLVYVLRCQRCNVLYIGETGRTLETRFSEHLADLRHGRQNSPVTKHFSLPGHTQEDLRVQILWLVTGDIVDRKHMESWFISKLGTKAPDGLNQKI